MRKLTKKERALVSVIKALAAGVKTEKRFKKALKGVAEITR